MTSRFINLLTVALLIILPTQLDAYITQNTGCHHNGTWYADKSLVPSMEKCLTCQCNKKTLVCRLKVCPEMPMPPPRGCVVVQKRNTCCPYLSCARLDAFYKIPTKRRIIAYLDHYERESIDRVVNDNMLQRRSDDTEVDLFVCVKNGTVYKSGSAMSSSNLCSYCYCIGGSEKCVKPKCMLPVEGCKPIFVDSTCCPVRYDCSQKASGKSSQEVRYRKTANKHFLRMSQRPQRNRGCTVGKQFYAEGQKMKSDLDKPCDICFCIRGSRRCAPKKCAPALKNCIPVVPKGQCCPSSYDCGAQRDYRRAHNSRQFNLFSLFFDQDENGEHNGTAIAEQYPHDRRPTAAPLAASSEKSIFDTLREGLEFIDSNNNQMLTDNLDQVAVPSDTVTEVTPSAATFQASTELNSPTELSFLDLLLGPTDNQEHTTNSVEQSDTSDEKSTTTQKGLSWVDLLLGPDDDDAAESSENSTVSSSNTGNVQGTTESPRPTVNSSIERVGDDFDEYLGSAEVAVGELPAEAQALTPPSNPAPFLKSRTTKTPLTSTTIAPQTLKPTESNINATQNDLSTTAKPLRTPEKYATMAVSRKPSPAVLPTPRPLPAFKPLPAHKPHHRINSKIANLTVSPPPMITTKTAMNATMKLSGNMQPMHIPIASITSTLKTTTKTTTSKPSTTSTTTSPTTTSTSTPTTTSTTTTTARPTTSTTTTTTTTTEKPMLNVYITTTAKPLVIKTNPTILEAEPSFDSNEKPTLPPSLPNLKIIPFLPTDAVSTDQQQQQQQQQPQQGPLLDFYKTATSKIDYELYDDPGLYPAITSSYPLTYNDAHDKAEYIYKFNIEGPESVPKIAPSVTTHFDYGLVSAAAAAQGFSPPIKTEGGFMPKEPLVIDGEVLDAHIEPQVVEVKDSYHVTQHIIDITSAHPENTTKLIEITTPDPFKDVIRTEPPPDLNALKVEKQKPNETTSQSKLQPQHEIDKADIEQINKLGLLLDELLGVVSATTSTQRPPTRVSNNTNPPKQYVELKRTTEQPKIKQQTTTEAYGKNDTTTRTTTTTPPAPAKAQILAIATTMSTTKVVRTKSKPKQPQRNATNTMTTHKRTSNGSGTVTVGKPARIKVQQVGTHKRNATKSATTTTTTMPIVRQKSTTKATTTTAKTTTTMTTPAVATPTTTTTANPFLMSPFDKLPFMDTSYNIKPYMQQQQQQQQAQRHPQLDVLHYKQTLNKYEGLEPNFDTGYATSTAHSTAATTKIIATTTTTKRGSGNGAGDHLANSLIDAAGMLKLAGCNIYGRMYRVGRIILELSGPCLECRCTEIGVKCAPLDC